MTSSRAALLRHFLQADLRLWQLVVLVLCGMWVRMAGEEDLRLGRASTAAAVPVSLEALEAALPDNRHATLSDGFVPLRLWVPVAERSDANKFNSVFYALVSSRRWDRAVEQAQAARPGAKVTKADVYPLLSAAVVVRTRRWRTAPELETARVDQVSGLLTDEKDERDAFFKALKTMKDLSPVYRGFPKLDESRLLVLDEGRAPRPVPWAMAELALSVFFIGAGALALAARALEALFKRLGPAPAAAPPPAADPRLARRHAGRLRLAAFAAFAGAMVCGALLMRGYSSENDDLLAAAGLVSLCLVAAPAANSRAKRYLAAASREELAQDARAPVLYLRSFADDMVTAEDPERPMALLLLLAPGQWLGFALGRGATEEELLAQALQGLGPVVAIGRPGEALPEAGAIRLYVTNEEWQAKVAEEMRKAALVVLRLGATAGFRWELERSASRLDPKRLVLLVPFGRKTYDRFRSDCASLFPQPLPDFEESRFRFRSAALGSLRGLIYFGPAWEPHFVDLARAKPPLRYLLRYAGLKTLWARLHWALRPVYEQVGAAWDPPPVPRRYYAYAVVIGLLALAVAGVLLLG